MTKSIAKNIQHIRERIEKAALKSGRNPKEIQLVAVTKNVPHGDIQIAMNENIFDFAENKVQELKRHYDICSERCRWHFIGRLQTNKVKEIIHRVDLIHSLDRIELLQELNKRAGMANKKMNTLLQVNISGEKTKAGVYKNDVCPFLNMASKYPNIRIKGLMTIAPKTNSSEEIRWIFKEMLQLSIDVRANKEENVSMEFLSMGMSNDFEIAIEEGANIIRIGSEIFDAS